MYVCMYVCLFVTGLRLKYTDLSLVYVLFLARVAHDAIAMEVKVEESEDRRRQHQNKSRDRNRLTAQQNDEDKITVTGDDFRGSSRTINFAH